MDILLRATCKTPPIGEQVILSVFFSSVNRDYLPIGPLANPLKVRIREFQEQRIG